MSLHRPRYFYSPAGLPITGGSLGIAVGSVGNPIAVPIPIPIPIPVPTPIFAMASPSSSRFQSVAVVVITRGRSGQREILMQHDGPRASILTVDLLGQDAHSVLTHLVNDHGLTHFGKKTYIEHIYKTTGERTLCCVIYASEVSRYRIDMEYRRRHPHVPHLARFLIGTHRHRSIETKSHSMVSMSDWVYHLVHSIDELWSNFV